MVDLTVHDAVTLTGTPTYVPDGSAIHDGDTSTYIAFVPSGPGVTGQSAAVAFDLSSVDFSSITFTAVVSRPTSSGARFAWDITDANGRSGGINSNVDVGSNNSLTASAGVLQTITRTFDDAYFAPGGQGETQDFVNPPGMTLQEWLAGLIAFAPGPHVVIGSNLRSVRVHEITLSGVPTATGSFPFRRYPPVRNGGHGPTRHWPKSMNRRPGTNT